MANLLSGSPGKKAQISEELRGKVINFAVSHVEIVALYVFGSTATGKNRAGSDIDVAIMVRGSIRSMERVRLETSLSNLLERDVDLIIFGEASALLRHQILKYGDLVYESDPKERVRQEVFARREYLDSIVLYKLIEGYG